MKGLKVSSRYAKSLLDLSVEKGLLEQIYQDMQLIAKTCRDSRDFHLFLKSPVIKSHKKEEVITTLFTNKVSELTLAFIKILNKNGRESLLELISQSFINQYKAHKNILSAEVTSVISLDDDASKQFIDALNKLTGKHIELENQINRDLIGGFVLKMEDKQLDKSIKTQLNNIKKDLLSNANSFINN
jgi:F-type H+-transporting ATPase subunit delta